MLGTFLVLGVVVVYLTGCAALKTNPKAQLQVIPERAIVSAALMKEPIKFKGSGFASKESVVVEIIIPKGVEVKGLIKGENAAGLAYAIADEQGYFEAAMEPLATMNTLMQAAWITTETGAKPDFKMATPLPPGIYTIRASGIDSGQEAKTTLMIISPPEKK